MESGGLLGLPKEISFGTVDDEENSPSWGNGLRSETSKRRKERLFTATKRGHTLVLASKEGTHVAGHLRAREKDEAAKQLAYDGIHSSRFCKWMEQSAIENLIAKMMYHEFQAGEIVVEQGDVGSYFFVLQEGSLEVQIDGQTANAMGPGDSFGGIALLYNCPRTATVLAKEDCGIWGIDGEVFRQVMQQYTLQFHAENRQALDALAILSGLSNRQKEMVGQLALISESFPTGAPVAVEGQLPAALYVVKKGKLHLVRGASSATGKLEGGEVIGELEVGQCFGEHAVQWNKPLDCSLVAADDCELACVGVLQLREIFGEDLGDVLERSFAASVLKRVPILADIPTTLFQRIIEKLEVVSLLPNSCVDPSVQLAVVVDGMLMHAGSDRLVQRGEWLQSPLLLSLEEDRQAESRSGVCCSMPDLVAGSAGCRLAVLTLPSLIRSVEGVECQGTSEEEIAQLRRVLLIHKVPLFRTMSDEQVLAISQLLELNVYAPGTKVLMEGELGTFFYIVSHGQVQVSVKGQVVRTAGRGACFGERALFFQERQASTVEILEEATSLWSIDHTRFQKAVPESMRVALVQRLKLSDTSLSLRNLQHVRLIGAGSFGSVRLVEHVHTRCRYALKRVRKNAEEATEDLERECTLLAELDHPFVLRLVKTFETTHSVYILTELITGGQLYDQMMERMGVLSRRQAQFYIGALVLILEYLHEKQIVYRDLKPENVMLDSQGFLKLVDFGLAKKLGGGRTFTLVGTVYYMAPDVINGTGYGLEADIWSMGVMLYELMCGRLPFGDGLETDFEIMASIMEEELTFPAKYNDQAGRKLITGLLSKSVDSRLGVKGWQEVKTAKFFKAGVSGDLFSQILGREIEPPSVPQREQYSNESTLNEKISLSDSEELAESQTAQLRDQILDIFRRFDSDGNGKLDAQEMMAVLRKLNGDLGDAELQMLIQAADTNGDGIIEFEEFLSWICSPEASPDVFTRVLQIHD